MPATRLSRLVGILPIPRESVATIARLMVKFGIVERAAAINISAEAFHENSFVDAVKQSGFLRDLWK